MGGSTSSSYVVRTSSNRPKTMLKNKKIGLIGSGNMARALISGVLKEKYVPANQIYASDHRASKAENFKKVFRIHTTTDNKKVARLCDVIILAVKPQVLEKVSREISAEVSKKKLVISLAAGVSTQRLGALLPARIIRTMPNVAALVSEGATGICAGASSTNADMNLATSLFNAVGKTVVLDESLMDAVTGLSASGPAYVFMMIDSLADAGVKVGLSRRDALCLSAQMVLGAAKLLIETGEHPGKLKDMVTSPGGTAIAGIATLEQGGLRTTFIKAVEAATKRSKELGED